MERCLAYQFSKGPVEVGAAELSGFLKGISYLNQDRRFNFAESFLLNSISEETLLQEISAIFEENPIPPFVVSEELEITRDKLEQELNSSILCSSYIADREHEADLAAYISFKIMDRIDDIFEPKIVKRVKKLIGSFGSEEGTVTFYCLVSSSHTLVIYLHAGAEKAPH